MTYDKLKKYTCISIIVLSITLILVILNNYIGEAIRGILVPLVIAFFLRYLLGPLCNSLQEKLKIKNRSLTVFIVMTLFFITFLLFMYFVGNFIIDQIYLFIVNDFDNIINYLNIQFNTDIFLQVKNFIKDLLNSDTLLLIIMQVNSVISILISSLLVIVFLFYMLKDGSTLTSGIISVIPKKFQNDISYLCEESHNVISKYFTSQFKLIFIMWMFYTICFSCVMTFPKAIMFAFILAILDLIPFVGPTIGLILPLLFTLTATSGIYFSNYICFIAVFVSNIVGQILEGNVLQPLIMSKAFEMHPLLILICLLFFGSIFGLLGVILAVPFAAIIKVVYNYFKESNKQIKA